MPPGLLFCNYASAVEIYYHHILLSHANTGGPAHHTHSAREALDNRQRSLAL